MKVRSIDQVRALPMHHGTVPVEPRAMKQETAGDYPELIAEFEVTGGSDVDPHSPTRTSTTRC